MSEPGPHPVEILSTPSGRLPALLHVLTTVSGIVDAVSFFALGRVFTANMTGNVVFLAFAVAGAPGLSIPRSLAAFLAFFIGAVIGGRMATAMSADSRNRWLATAFLAESGLFLVATVVAFGFGGTIQAAQDRPRAYAIIGLTALAMGIRNATVRKLAMPDLTTTVLTLTVTGLGADSSLAGGGNLRRGRRMISVACMFAGAAAGFLLLRYSLALPLAICAVVSCACAIAAGRGWASG